MLTSNGRVMIATTWIGFFIAVTVLMLMARVSIWAGLFMAALILGGFSLSSTQIIQEILNTVKEPSILLLALAVGIIPIIGGAMEISGLIEDLVSNLRLKKRNFVAFSPALFGSLPMPGGALLSAPLIEKGGKGISSHKKAAVNVWFRHVLLLVYPLGALLATTKIAGVDLFVAILYLLPAFGVALLLGYLFLLKDIQGDNSYVSDFDAKKLAIPLSVILAAPILDLLLINIFEDVMKELPLVIAVCVSLFLAFYFGGLGVKDIKTVAKKMEPWNFFLIIIAMFTFLNVFKASDAPSLIAELSVSKTVLIVVIGALLGFVTGRVQVPVSIIVPIYLTKYGETAMTPVAFAFIYFSIFMGYMVSPVHPCVSVSLEYFDSTLKNFFKTLVPPAVAGLIIASLGASMLL